MFLDLMSKLRTIPIPVKNDFFRHQIESFGFMNISLVLKGSLPSNQKQLF